MYRDRERRPPCEDEGTEWSDASTNQRIPGPPEAGRRKERHFP